MKRSFPTRRPNVVDFFCGAGGLSLGFEQAGFNIVLGVDQDGHHVATHDRNFPYGKSHCGSVVDLTGDKVKELAGVDEIDVVIGGPPCQGFSHMGLRDLKDPRNTLVAHYMRLILEISPKAFLMENVPGLISGKTRFVLDEVIQLAEENGYEITKPVRVLDASDFGVPQKRRRLFLLGIRSDVGSAIPYPDGPCNGQPGRPTVLEAIGDLPDVESNDRLFSENSTQYTKVPTSEYAKAARGLYEDPSDVSRPRVWDSDTCSGCLRVNHTAKTVELYNATPVGQTVPGHKLPRLAPDGISPTLRAGSDSTHGSYTAPRPIHPVHPRCITSREAARLHGFPDWFAFYPLKWHAYRQIGNAVCPPIARAIGEKIIDKLVPKRTSRKPAPVILGDTFVLPEDRPRTLKRIPVMQEFPPVIDYLFSNAYDVDKQRLRKASFTFTDVKDAIEKTKVNLHWVREDTFLGEIARSRAVKRMLANVHEAGYSIIEETGGGKIGRFVPLGTPGTIEDKDTIQIRIDEIHNAVTLKLPHMQLNGKVENVEKVVSQPDVQRIVWGAEKAKLMLVEPARLDHAYPLEIKAGRAKSRKSVIVTGKTSAPPTRSRISRVASEYDCDEVVLFMSATSRHFIAIRYEKCQSNPKEASRTAFCLSK